MNEMKTLQRYYDILCEKYGEHHILGVFLYGSQNYNIATENSDIDAKAIYIPSLYSMAKNTEPISKEIAMENGAHIEVKDIRLMCKMWQKQNINFVEILFTKYCIVNPAYQHIWKRFSDIRHEIAYYNRYQTIKACYWQAQRAIHKGSITAKELVNAQRLIYFLDGYQKGHPYEMCITPNEEFAKELRDKKAAGGRFDMYHPEVQAARLEFDKFWEYAEHFKDTLNLSNCEVEDEMADITVDAFLSCDSNALIDKLKNL